MTDYLKKYKKYKSKYFLLKKLIDQKGGFELGSRVVTKGLSRAEYNDKVGTVEKHLTDNNGIKRIKVRIGPSKSLSIRPTNLISETDAKIAMINDLLKRELVNVIKKLKTMEISEEITNHFKKKFSLKPMLIPGKGIGIYTTKQYNKGELIFRDLATRDYAPIGLKKDESTKFFTESVYQKTHSLGLSKRLYPLGTMLNHSINYNCLYTLTEFGLGGDVRLRLLNLYAIRDIEPNEEILIHYLVELIDLPSFNPESFEKLRENQLEFDIKQLSDVQLEVFNINVEDEIFDYQSIYENILKVNSKENLINFLLSLRPGPRFYCFQYIFNIEDTFFKSIHGYSKMELFTNQELNNDYQLLQMFKKDTTDVQNIENYITFMKK